MNKVEMNLELEGNSFFTTVPFAGELGADAVHPEHDDGLLGGVPLEVQGVEETRVAAQVNHTLARLVVYFDDVLFGVLLAPVTEHILLSTDQSTLLELRPQT